MTSSGVWFEVAVLIVATRGDVGSRETNKAEAKQEERFRWTEQEFNKQIYYIKHIGLI